MSNKALIDLINEYNKLHLEVIRTTKRLLFETNQVQQTPDRKPRWSDDEHSERSTSAKTTPGKRLYPKKDEWSPDEVELLQDLVTTYPQRPAGTYQRKLKEMGVEKSMEAIKKMLENTDQSTGKRPRVASSRRGIFNIDSDEE